MKYLYIIYVLDTRPTKSMKIYIRASYAMIDEVKSPYENGMESWTLGLW